MEIAEKEQITVMANLKLTQLSTSEYKLDSVVDFCLNANGNCMSLIGNSNDVTIFELTYSCDPIVLMPYNNKQIIISQHKPLSKVIKNIDLVQIYASGTVPESQELALDIIYTADCAVESLKARFLQADIITKNNARICCVLTTYGHCEIFKKDVITGEWKSLETNLSNILITDVFPLQLPTSYIKNYTDFKTFTNKFKITSFAMSLHASDMIVYLGTAAGYIIAVKYNETSCKFEVYCTLKTSLNCISYIVKFHHYILVGCDQGKVLLVKINFEDVSLRELEYLWSKSDRMSCRKAIFNFSETLNSYLVVFCKASHLLAYCLDVEGVVLSSSTLYVSGIKITGIETINENEFIITTITGAIKHIKISRPTKDELQFEEEMIDHDFDSSNYQILGVAASLSKNLWSFLLYRNKDYIVQLKHSFTSAFVNVCKLSSQDSFAKLINSKLKNMNIAQDLVVAINLDIFNNMEMNKYMEYLNLGEVTFSEGISDDFLQKLQIKIIIARKLAEYQNKKYKKIKNQTNMELQILEPVLQLLHILARLRFLKQLSFQEKALSQFQQQSINNMQLQFSSLLGDIGEINNSIEENTIHSTVDKFVAFCNDEFAKNKFDTRSFGQVEEYCLMCNQEINNFQKCVQEHDVKRCTISYTQLTLFKSKYCPHCYALARNDDAGNLQELYSADESITCIYCKFLFKQDDF